MTPTRGGRLAGVAIVGGFGLILFALLAFLVRFLRLALLGIAYAAAVILACLLLAAQNIAGRIRRRRRRPLAAYPLDDDRLWPAPPIEPYDVTGPIPPPAALTAQDPPTLVDTARMTATRIDLRHTTERRIGTANRLAALARLIDARPSLDADDAAVLVDAAASFVAADNHAAAARLLALTAPGTAAELVDLLDPPPAT